MISKLHLILRRAVMALSAVVFAFAITASTPSGAAAQGKPEWAGKKSEKGSRKEDAREHARERGKGKKKGFDKEKKEKKKKKEKKGKKGKK